MSIISNEFYFLEIFAYNSMKYDTLFFTSIHILVKSMINHSAVGPTVHHR